MNTHHNPLSAYFRTPKHFITLPSKGKHYQDGVLELSDHGEIGILPMTAKDELLFQTPDALLNGETLKQVIKSCAIGVKKPEKLLNNDIEAILIAIKHASFGDELTLASECPECGHENSYGLSITESLSSMKYLDDHYIVNMESGVSVFLAPYTFESQLKMAKSAFEEDKLLKNIGNPNLSEEEQLRMISNAVRTMSSITFELMLNCVEKICMESDGVEVVEKQFIEEYLQNISTEESHIIQEQIKEINNIGIKKIYHVSCGKCNHEWDQELDINPTDFFTKS